MGKKKITIEQSQSKAFKFNSEDIRKLGKSLLLTMIAGFLAWLIQVLPMIDYGEYNTIIYLLMPFLVNFLRKLIANSKLKI